eukprot:TRINITY_DN12340_c0_g1_i1.p1 TRINITY_DN12340_c0_g1~~TRINITY_DN12340_c0_g1_i1.p1  ORF type:complete len:284 (-),score=42.03 TRINITY_DN12340_c0_g1_i1:166-1017(-)
MEMELDNEELDTEALNSTTWAIDMTIFAVTLTKMEGKEEEVAAFRQSNPYFTEVDGERLFQLRSTQCANCSSSTPSSGNKLSRCSNCKLLHYCSSQCQRNHWPSHRDQCQGFATMLKEVAEVNVMPIFYRYLCTELISLPEFYYLQSKHMIALTRKVKESTGDYSPVSLAASWMELPLSVDGVNYSHPVFFLSWVGTDLASQPETFLRLWVVAGTLTNEEKDVKGREFIGRLVRLLEYFELDVVAVSTSGGFLKQGALPVTEFQKEIDDARELQQLANIGEVG